MVYGVCVITLHKMNGHRLRVGGANPNFGRGCRAFLAGGYRFPFRTNNSKGNNWLRRGQAWYHTSYYCIHPIIAQQQRPPRTWIVTYFQVRWMAAIIREAVQGLYGQTVRQPKHIALGGLATNILGGKSAVTGLLTVLVRLRRRLQVQSGC